MTKEELIKELEELRDIENYSQSELLNRGYRTGLLDALDLVNEYFDLADVIGRSEQLIEKHLFGKKPKKWDDEFDRIQHLSVNDIYAMLDEHYKCVLSNVSARLHSSLGECVEGNDYEIVADEDGRFWINHKGLGSGEPLEQWIDSALNVR